MYEQALKLASHVPHPETIAVIAVFIAVVGFILLLRAKQTFVGCILAAVFLVVGLAPWFASHSLRSDGVYHVHVVLLRPDQTAVDIAQVKSSNGGELKMVAGGWELDVPKPSRPADGKLTFSAAVKDEFLKGSSTLVLADDYYPTATIQLVAETSAMVRGVVVTEDLVAVAGATVSIEGHPDVAMTDAKGNFVLPGHAGKGQTVEILARKGQLTGHLSARAGNTVEVVLGRE
jgi:hypothetical protein